MQLFQFTSSVGMNGLEAECRRLGKSESTERRTNAFWFGSFHGITDKKENIE